MISQQMLLRIFKKVSQQKNFIFRPLLRYGIHNQDQKPFQKDLEIDQFFQQTIQIDESLTNESEIDKQNQGLQSKQSQGYKINRESKSIDQLIQEIINANQQYQITLLRDLYLHSPLTMREGIKDAVKNTYNKEISSMLRLQANYYLKKHNKSQLFLLFKVINMYGNYLYKSLHQQCFKFDAFVREEILQNAEPLNYITLSNIYSYFLQNFKEEQFLETSKIINSYVMSNQDKYPDSAITTHYLRYKDIFHLSQNDVKLNFNENLSDSTILLIKFTSCKQNKIADDLWNHIKKQQFDIQTLNLLFSNNLKIGEINLNQSLKNIQEKQIYSFKNKADIIYTYTSLTTLFKHLIHFFEKEQRIQQVKNIGLQSTSKKRFPFVTNCIEAQSIFLPLGYSPQQEECFKTLLEITKQYIQILDKNSFKTNLTLIKTSLFYQISKIQMDIDPEIVQYAFENIRTYYKYIKGMPIINSFCTLCNFYQHDQFKQEVTEIIQQIRPNIIENLHNLRYQNDIFIISYSAYLFLTKLDQIEIAQQLIDILDQTVIENKFISYNTICTILFLELIEQQIPKAKKVLNNLKEKRLQISFIHIKQALIHSTPSNKLVHQLIIDWFVQNVQKLEMQEITFYLHFLNKKKLSHLIRKKSDVIQELKQKFLNSKQITNYMMTEYRRNFFMDDELLQMLEQQIIQQIDKKQVKLEKAIDSFYNITRLRHANQQFVEKINSLPQYLYQNLGFSDYVKLINSYIHQEVSQEIIQKAMKDLLFKIQNGQFDLKQEPFQQKKIFFICLQQIKFQYPQLNLQDKIIASFIHEMQIKSKEEGLLSAQSITEIDDSENEEESHSSAEYSPYEKIIQDSLQNLNIPFQREYVIEYFKTDFYLPQQKIIIEFNGDLHFFNGEITPPTKQKIKYLEHLNYKVIELSVIKQKQLFSQENMTQHLKEIIYK
ncbi:hypothetical protein TTHERM_00138190 (macronuclear) [Tetrahymena thermophila SB210]|uniref:RAP domain protein n=1 Tax=Tetrahymena thermophila (strain SB210) TaxID=312017 RepID=I7M291_TETTS|nr:hypothetical protein TTHERM_00138190 [Tetrahymena thermophila SB210]EAR99556.2 hypothetical protein TTHERM_00138190 [Tetrahymena thermophila SB210]|eukprot:XP_001019801.2 hypothetical protein TTHERM_00138190 [Tetrahymena thermophila SB210]